MKDKLVVDTKAIQKDWNVTFGEYANIDALTQQREREYKRLTVQVKQRSQFAKTATAISKKFNAAGIKNKQKLNLFEVTIQQADHHNKLVFFLEFF